MRNYLVWTVLAALVTVSPSLTWAASVSYSGRLSGIFGQPQVGGFVTAGTFAPGHTAESWILANNDSSGNVNADVYTLGVSSGVIVPIGIGAATFFDGSFS